MQQRGSLGCVCSLTLVVCGVISSSVLRFVRFADEFGASGNIETKEQGKRKPQMLQSLLITYVELEVLSASVKLKVLSAPYPPPRCGVCVL